MKPNASIKNSIIKSCALGFALSAYAFSASAAPTPYADTGVENSIEYSFTAAADGDIVAYFVSKGGAYYSNTLSISINGVDVGISGLQNQTSAYGDSINFGHANAGDTIVFSIYTADLNQVWYSDKSQNDDGANHVFSNSYAGDEFIPAGVYVAFEDLFPSNSDYNYLDEQFVVANVTTGGPGTPEVPVPAAGWLLGSALVGLGGVARRRTHGRSIAP